MGGTEDEDAVNVGAAAAIVAGLAPNTTGTNNDRNTGEQACSKARDKSETGDAAAASSSSSMGGTQAILDILEHTEGGTDASQQQSHNPPEDLKDSGIRKEDEELSDYIGSDEEELDPVKDLGTVISDNCRISRSENRWNVRLRSGLARFNGKELRVNHWAVVLDADL